MAETTSTSEALKDMMALSSHPSAKTVSRLGLVLVADYQTAGRGQRGNSWESERGKNLLMSVMLWPKGVEANRQFLLSQMMALAIHDAVDAECLIKWPNDIYCGEKKLSGTIIENTLRGEMVEQCVLGVGVNVNQRVFKSDAPNPVSLCQIVGHEVDREGLLNRLLERVGYWYGILLNGGGDEIASAYVERLMWRAGLHRYCDASGEFEAEFVNVEPDGRLVLRDTNGKIRGYYFKEVKHVLFDYLTI